MNPPRTSAKAVEAILANNWDGSTSVTPYIQTASSVVDRVATCAAKKGYPLSTSELELIERWLSGYYYCKNDPLYMSKSTAGASASFQRKVGDGFDANEFGQVAVNLDISGCLSAIGKRQFASLAWLGKPPSEQIPFDQRD